MRGILPIDAKRIEGEESCYRKKRGEPGPPLEKELLDDRKFATVAEPGLPVAGGIDGDTEYDVIACRRIGRHLEGDFNYADQVG